MFRISLCHLLRLPLRICLVNLHAPDYFTAPLPCPFQSCCCASARLLPLFSFQSAACLPSVTPLSACKDDSYSLYGHPSLLLPPPCSLPPHQPMAEISLELLPVTEPPLEEFEERLQKRFTGLYIVLLSVHGLVRGDNMELGKDPDTGGQAWNSQLIIPLCIARARGFTARPSPRIISSTSSSCRDSIPDPLARNLPNLGKSNRAFPFLRHRPAVDSLANFGRLSIIKGPFPLQRCGAGPECSGLPGQVCGGAGTRLVPDRSGASRGPHHPPC